MDPRCTVPQLDKLFHRLAVVNAKLHEVNDQEGKLLSERREIMELISRERLGQARQLVWKPEDGFNA